jgi:glycerate dehydrogenase
MCLILLCLTAMQITVLDGQTLNPGDLSWDWLSAFGTYAIYERTPPENLAERALPANILLVNKVVIDEELISRLPQLQYIVVTATGYNNIDIAACRRAGIPVSNVTNYGSATVAQHVFALLLSLTNRVEKHHLLVRDGAWIKSNSFSFWDAPLVELSAKTMGIVGMGNIGREVARIAAGFRMNVLFYSASQAHCEHGRAVRMDELTADADVISLHTHLHDGNREMVNAAFLEKMKRDAYLINTARGGLVHEGDLFSALSNGVIAGAGLDVLSVEPPPPDFPLLSLKNCIITPHNAWASVEARRRMMDIVQSNISAFLSGSPIHLVH